MVTLSGPGAEGTWSLVGPWWFSFLENIRAGGGCVPSRDGKSPQDPVYRSGRSRLCGVGSGPRAQQTDGCRPSTRGQWAEGQGQMFLGVSWHRSGEECCGDCGVSWKRTLRGDSFTELVWIGGRERCIPFLRGSLTWSGFLSPHPWPRTCDPRCHSCGQQRKVPSLSPSPQSLDLVWAEGKQRPGHINPLMPPNV